jgi:uncharacterized protein (TIGR02147 family)
VAHGFIILHTDGSANLPDRGLKCHGGIYNLTLGQYHKEMHELAAAAVTDVEADARSHSGYATAIPAEKFEALREILNETRRKVAELEAECEDSDSVFYVSLAAFPLARKSRKKKSEE